MPTLKYQRLRRDMIEIKNGIYDHNVVTSFFELSNVEQNKKQEIKL